MRIVREGEVTWLPGVRLDELPSGLPNGIRLHSRAGELGIEARGLVGAIHLRGGETVQIRPKIGSANFFRMLFTAEGHQHALQAELQSFTEYSITDEEGAGQAAARQLYRKADEILRRGFAKDRTDVRLEGDYALGRIDPVATALRVGARLGRPIVYRVRCATIDTPENRVITEALHRAWPMLPFADQQAFGSVRRRWNHRQRRPTRVAHDLHTVARAFAARQFGGPRDYYRRALLLAQIILGQNGFGLETAAEVVGDSMLLETATVFERYLREVIAQTHSPEGLVVTKGAAGVPSLYASGEYELTPDIVIARDAKPILVLDAKYKEIDATDHYQMLAYLRAAGIRRGVLLCPGSVSKDVVVKEFATSDATIVFEAHLPLTDLSATEAFLGSVARQFSRTRPEPE